MKTLLLNPPSFEMFDGGASSRYQATREIPSFWYPVWLAYSAGMIKDSRLLDAPSHNVTPEETIKIATEYEFLVLFTSTPGFKSDRSEEHTSELQSRLHLVCRLLLEKKKKRRTVTM